MPIDSITAHAVREALRAIRFAKPLGDSSLLRLRQVEREMQRAGLGDTAESRAWVLQQQLVEGIEEGLGSARDRQSVGRDSGGGFEADFSFGDPDLEAWSMLHLRYVHLSREPNQAVADRLGMVKRTLMRRLSRGYELLSQELLEREMGVAGEAPDAKSSPGAEPRPGAEKRAEVEAEAKDRASESASGAAPAPSEAPTDEPATRLHPAAQRLMDAVLAGGELPVMTALEAAEIARAPLRDLGDYHRSRIAEWAQPRYRLGSRFVPLEMLLDVADTRVAMPEGAGGKAVGYTGLDSLLAETVEPALVLIGPPGTGKSTLLRHLEMDLSIAALRGEGDRIPVYLPLSRFGPGPDGHAQEAREWLFSGWAERYPQLPGLASLMAEGRVLFLLDGLNEMAYRSREDYRAAVGAWRRFLETSLAGSRNRAVFTCRSFDYSVSLSSSSLPVPQVWVQALDDERIESFVRAHAGPSAGPITRLLARRTDMELLRSPFFLRLMIDLAWTKDGLPEGRAALITGFVRSALRREVERNNPLFAPAEGDDAILHERDVRGLLGKGTLRKPWGLPQRGALIPALERLAFRMQDALSAPEGAQVRLDYDSALDAVGGGAEAGAVLAAGAALGVLEDDAERDEVFFGHQLLQEYFAGRRLRSRWDEAPERITRSWRASEQEPDLAGAIAALGETEALPGLPATGWEESVALALAMSQDPGPALARVAECNLSLAGYALGQADLRDRIEEDQLESLRWALVKRSRDPEADLRERIACCLALGPIGDPRLVEHRGPEGRALLPPMVEIPAGAYPIGDDESIEWDVPWNKVQTELHMPRHLVRLERFFIAKFPVTNAEWARFIEAGGYEDDRWWVTEDSLAWRRGLIENIGQMEVNRLRRRRYKGAPEVFRQFVREDRLGSKEDRARWIRWMALDDAAFERELVEFCRPEPATEPFNWRDDRLNHPAQPVVGISFYEALAYCAWLSSVVGLPFRLPSEVEWEAAARGKEGRRFAFGNRFDGFKTNTESLSLRRSSPIGVFPEGETPEGISDMSGNVVNWTCSILYRGEIGTEYRYPYDPKDGRENLEAPPSHSRVVKGGSWPVNESLVDAIARHGTQPEYRGSANHGLRLAYSPEA